ncbi:MAG: substrate-binding domain-containing protein [Bacteroidetes bacterium]|nr:substrate-binding domain-containing protein [Bacteroidota bacterium]
MTRNTFILMLAGLLIWAMLSSCGSSQDRSKSEGTSYNGTLSFSGAFALYPMAVKWAEEYMKLHPGVRIDISAGGAGKGMTDVLTGMVEVGMVSRTINPQEKSKGAYEIAVTRDAVVPTFNEKNPFRKEILSKGLTREKFQAIFLSAESPTWGQMLGNGSSQKITVYTRSDACGAAEMWAKFLGKNQEALQGVGVFGDPGIADAVKADANSIGFNNINYAYDISSKKKYPGLEVVPVDLNGNGSIEAAENFYNDFPSLLKAIKEGTYPSPPARDLYFVTRGKPTNPVLTAFLTWVLTDGQKLLESNGYIALSPEQIQGELNKIK